MSANQNKNASDYRSAEPKFLGNLHERMQLVMAIMRNHGPKNIPDDLWHAVFDLETEVEDYKPVDPPFGRRPVKHRR